MFYILNEFNYHCRIILFNNLYYTLYSFIYTNKNIIIHDKI